MEKRLLITQGNLYNAKKLKIAQQHFLKKQTLMGGGMA